MKSIVNFLQSYKPLLFAITLICLIAIGEREIKTLVFILALEFLALASGFGATKTLSKSDDKAEPLRDGMIFLGAQFCVGFCAIGVYFLQF